MAVLAHEGNKTIMFDAVAIPMGASTVDGFLARPDVTGSSPCVIVLHGIAGSAGHERALCRTLARHGYVAIAPDLYRGEQPASGDLDDEASRYESLADARALTDIGEVIEFLDSPDTPWADPTNVVVIGYDVGGRFALNFAARSSRVGAVVSMSGPLVSSEGRDVAAIDEVASINVPVLGLYGMDDQWVDIADIDSAQAATSNGTWIVYEGAGHNFYDDSSESFDAGATQDAYQRVLSLLTTVFG